MAYVYIWFRPDWVPFYVGIGKTPSRWNPCRAKDRDRNNLCMKIIRKYGAENIHVQTFKGLTWEEACSKEQSLIAHFGRMDGGGLLANFTDGGEGVLAPRQEVTNRRRAALLEESNPMRKSHILLNSDPEIRAKRKESLNNPEVKEKIKRASTDRWKDSRYRLNISEKMKAIWEARRAINPPPEKPKRRTKEELAEYRRQLLKERNADPEYQAKRLAALKNASAAISKGVNASQAKRLETLATPEVQAKLKRPKTAEHNRKVSEAKKAWWANRKAGIGHLVG